jgi:poly-beta-hydroxybutyrate-responsive repressor
MSLMKTPSTAPKRQGKAARLPSEMGPCPCTGVTLDKLIRPAVLTVLAGGDLHGYAIVQRIGEMSIFRGQSPDAAGVYRALRAMEKEGMLTCQWDVSGRGPAKRQYRLTPPGRQCLEQWAMTLEQYRQAIGDLLDAVRHAGAACPAAAEGGKPARRPCCQRGR